MRTAARVLVDQLRIHGVERIFTVPGESFLDVLDALYDEERSQRMRVISCRQEGGAAFMAEAHGKLSGAPGVCFVTRGPGACNASIGVHTAFHDSTPMILFIGQVARGFLEREGFQEIDFRKLFAPISKWATQIEDPKRIPEILARAFQLAVSGRPGPIVIALPEDLLVEQIEVEDAVPYQRVQASPNTTQMKTLREMLSQSQRPLMIVGGGDWSEKAADDIRAFAVANNLPCAASFRAQDIVDNDMREYVGALGAGANPALNMRFEQADLILSVGDRLSEMITEDYRLLNAPRPKQKLVHIFPDPDELGRVYQADLPIASGMPEFASAARAMSPVSASRRASWSIDARADYERFVLHEATSEPLDLGEVYAHLRERLPQDAIVTNGAGNYSIFLHRFQRFTQYRTQVAPVNGTMGYGVPAAIAAKLAFPDRLVVAFAGDGCFLMNGQELATAMQYGANIVVIVVNNNRYGTIRTHQERRFPNRVVGTDLTNPNFANYAQAFGAFGEVITQTSEFASAFDRAVAADRTTLLELRV
jgi:acetolactate synthase-1/2/3 large subunit